MELSDITTWLESRDHNWKEGLALFVAFSNNKHMSRVLMAKSPTARSVNSLKYELKRILRTSPSLSSKPGEAPRISLAVKQTRKSPGVIQVKLPAPVTGEQSSNPIIVSLESKIKAKFVEAASLFYQLRYMKAFDRRLTCLRILDLLDERDRFWFLKDYVSKFGVLPSAEDAASQTDLKDKLHNLRTYISKHKANIKNAKTAETREKYQRKLDEMILERDSLEAKLSV